VNADKRTTDRPVTGATEASPTDAAQGARGWLRRQRPNWLGLVVGVLAFGWSITPSLLPRPWLFEGVICGLGAALGYGVGSLLSAILRRLRVPEPKPSIKRWAWRVLAIVGPVLTVIYLLLGVGWQNEVRTIVGMPDEGLMTSFQVIVVAIPVALGAVIVGRALRTLTGLIGRLIDRVLPRPISAVLAVAAVGAIVYIAVAGVLFRGFVAVMNNIYDGANASTAAGITQPTSPLRSGSGSSFVAWNTLGMEGRNFVARGPSAQQLANFSGKVSTTPIRVYVGLSSAPTPAERAQLAVKELERTGAFSRKVLVVAGTTGTGWLEPQSIDSVEYEWNGDTAVVGIQYSFLPSWISTLVDVDRARDAGQAIFSAVYTEWSKLPAGERPKLVSYGLSLGSFSAQSAFPDAAALTAQTQGAIYSGSPNFSQPWGQIAANRDAGSPEWQPIYQNGTAIRYAAHPGDFASPSGPWNFPRVAYLQHANDPVVWWSPQLLVEQPDWLREPPGAGRTPTMRWYPVLTFLQVTVDQFVGVDVPNGEGHNYGTTMPAAWAAVTQPPGWTDADTARLTTLVADYNIE
jgi:uncharacterized membrane protein